MKKILVCLIICYCACLNARILEVSASGTPYTTIMSALNNFIEGDTILVHPGRYYENVRIVNRHHLTIASTYLFTNDENDIQNTIIDGNEISSAFYIAASSNVSLIGLTVEHGRGINLGGNSAKVGGGICVNNSSNLNFKNNVIQFNLAFMSGGISISNSSVLLSDNTIRLNEAAYIGGIGINTNSSDIIVTFDPINKNSIFANAGYYSNDIFIIGYPEITIPLKKGSSINYDNYWVNGFYLEQWMGQYIAPEDSLVIHYTAEEEYFTPIDSDLYVSTNGNDSNSGTSYDQPLRNIYTAMSRIRTDDNNPRTIYVADGIYTPNPGVELFPIHMKDNVTLKGMNQYFTMDGRDIYSLITAFGRKNISIQNMKGININSTGYNSMGKGLVFEYCKGLIMENINLSISSPENNEKIVIVDVRANQSLKVNNIKIQSTLSNHIGMALVATPPTSVSNILTNNNYSGFSFLAEQPDLYPNGLISVSNIGVFNSNNQSTPLWGVPYLGSAASAYLFRDNVYLYNWTVAHNTGVYGPMLIQGKGEFNFYNSIFYDNHPNTIGFIGPSSNEDSLKVNFINCSFFEDSDSTFVSFYNAFQTETECIYGDPLFRGEGQYPFSLSQGSPCIDAGTNDLPEGISLPERDLAGNLRIIGSAVDIGAYEFNPLSVIQYPEEVITSKPFKCSVYPNPIDLSLKRNLFCNFDVEFTRDDDIDFSIYNIKGQKIITLAKGQRSPGMSRFNWDGKDENNKKIGSGVYLYKITGRDSEVSGKFTVID